jgi:uncharacterized membrane protein YqgA involved in biofilm formation
MFGTIVNVITIIIGTSIGVLFKRKLPEKIIHIIFQALGLFTLFFGIAMSLKSENYLVIIFSLALGAIIGQLIDIEKYITKLSEKIKKRAKVDSSTFNEGLITAFLLFCTGPMTILGAIDEGLRSNSELLLTKAVLDGFASIALASALGIGVGVAIIPLFIYQSSITLAAIFLGNFLPENLIIEISAIGGILLIGMAINMLEIKNIKVINMLPAIVIMPVLSYLVSIF